MATATQTQAVPQPSLGEERFLLDGISYDFYVAFCNEIGERPIRLSFSNGRLEIMITKSPHEFYKKMLAKLIETIILERNIPVRSGGSMTFQRSDLEKGFEPDDCWWIVQEAEVRGKDEFDFRKDPPPDLAIEIEISHSLVDRIGIFAAMGIKELWRHDGKNLRFCVLQDDQTYEDRDRSRAFPFLAPADLAPYLRLDDDSDETTRVRRFRDWLCARDEP